MKSKKIQLAILVLAQIGVQAPAFSGVDEDVARRVTINNKLLLLERLVKQSPTAQRIERSGDEDALSLLQDAQRGLERAGELLKKGRLDRSEKLVDQALRDISRASQSIADIQRDRKTAKAQFAGLMERVEAFDQSLRDAVKEKGDKQRFQDEQANINRLVAAAQDLAERGDYVEAAKIAKQAATELESVLAKARNNETLVYFLTFDTPEQAFAYEVQRNDSYALLIRLVTAEQTISESAQGYVTRNVEQNQRMREEADALAKAGKVEEATKKLEDATALLIKTLRMSGMQI